MVEMLEVWQTCWALGAGVNANAGGTVNMLDGGENNNADGNGGGGAVRGGEDNTGNNTD